LNNNKQHNK